MGIVITAAKPSSPPIPPTPENVLASARAAAAQIIFCVPTFIEVRLVTLLIIFIVDNPIRRPGLATLLR